MRRVAETTVRPAPRRGDRDFHAYLYTTDVEDTEYLALVLGDVGPDAPVLVRVQTASVLRDVFGAAPSDGDHPAIVPLRMIEEAGAGILLYVIPRGGLRTIGDGGSRSDARLRDFGLGAQVLAHLGARTIRLLTNHPRRIVGLGGYGIEVVECVPIRPVSHVVPLREPRGAGGEGSASEQGREQGAVVHRRAGRHRPRGRAGHEGAPVRADRVALQRRHRRQADRGRPRRPARERAPATTTSSCTAARARWSSRGWRAR